MLRPNQAIRTQKRILPADRATGPINPPHRNKTNVSTRPGPIPDTFTINRNHECYAGRLLPDIVASHRRREVDGGLEAANVAQYARVVRALLKYILLNGFKVPQHQFAGIPGISL